MVTHYVEVKEKEYPLSRAKEFSKVTVAGICPSTHSKTRVNIKRWAVVLTLKYIIYIAGYSNRKLVWLITRC